MSDLPTPINRNEQYLNAIATGNTVDMPAKPITREEQYLDYIARNGGGSGGAENYSQLSGKPQINNVELESGNNSLSALGIASESAVNGIKDGQSINSFSAVESALGNKVDKEAGKGLSENDYSDEEKGKVTANAEAIEATQDMISDAYDSTHTYNVGDYCIYNDTLYKCNTAIATGEAFTPAKWTATNVAEEIKVKSITPAIGSAYSDLAILQDSQCFQIGKLVIVNLKLSIDSEIPTGNILIKDLPKGLTSLGVNSGFSAMACNLPDMFLFAVNTQDGGGGLLLGSRSTPPTATALIVSGCYIAE